MSLQSQTQSFIKSGQFLRGWSKRTVRTYETAFKTLEGVELTKGGLEAWIVLLRCKGMSPGGVNVYIRSVNSFLSWLREEIENEIHPPIPPKLKLLRCPQVVRVVLTPAEIQLLTNYKPVGRVERRTHALILLLIDCGLRIEEALTLGIESVNFESLILKVRGKGSKERLIPFSLNLRKILWKLGSKIHQGPLFQTRDGLRLSYRNVAREMKELTKRAGLSRSIHPHLLRHTFAVRYLMGGGDLYRLSRMLGHTSLTTTALYLRGVGAEDLRLKTG